MRTLYTRLYSLTICFKDTYRVKNIVCHYRDCDAQLLTHRLGHNLLVIGCDLVCQLTNQKWLKTLGYSNWKTSWGITVLELEDHKINQTYNISMELDVIGSYCRYQFVKMFMLSGHIAVISSFRCWCYRVISPLPVRLEVDVIGSYRRFQFV